MAKHTEGPYTVVQPDDADNFGHTHIEIHDGYGRTATVYGEVSDAETQATSALLAAAPDLLAALQGVLRVADRATDEFDAARAAIARATAA